MNTELAIEMLQELLVKIDIAEDGLTVFDRTEFDAGSNLGVVRMCAIAEKQVHTLIDELKEHEAIRTKTS